MINRLPIVAALLILSACSSTRNTGPLLENGNLTYVNKASHITLALPQIKGWNAGIPTEGLARNIVYGAIHMGKILNLVLSVEPLNSDLEDYYILIKRANDFEKRSGFQKIALDTFTLNGRKAMRFIYKADIITIDSSLLYENDTLAGDSLADSPAVPDSTDSLSPYIYTPYVYTNIFMKQDEFNYWLEISTLEEGYERRKPFIEQVMAGLKVIK